MKPGQGLGEQPVCVPFHTSWPHQCSGLSFRNSSGMAYLWKTHQVYKLCARVRFVGLSQVSPIAGPPQTPVQDWASSSYDLAVLYWRRRLVRVTGFRRGWAGDIHAARKLGSSSVAELA